MPEPVRKPVPVAALFFNHSDPISVGWMGISSMSYLFDRRSSFGTSDFELEHRPWERRFKVTHYPRDIAKPIRWCFINESRPQVVIEMDCELAQEQPPAIKVEARAAEAKPKA